MNRDERDESWAVFWCALLEPVLFGEVSPQETHRFLRQLSRVPRHFPDGTTRRPSLSTLKRKLKCFRQGGLEALYRRPRRDRGQTRAHDPAVIARAIAIKRDQPGRSDETINRFLKAESKAPIPSSTLYRYLSRAGATRQARCRSRPRSESAGPATTPTTCGSATSRKARTCSRTAEPVPTHLSAFIDCHSRYVVEARYYLRQNLDILIDSLLRAWAVHGAPRAICTSTTPRSTTPGRSRPPATALHIRLLHRRARRSRRRRAHRTLLPDRPEPVRGRGPRRRHPDAGASQPRVLAPGSR